MQLRLLPVAVAIAALLVACGSDDSDAASGCTPGPTLTVGAEDSLEFDSDSFQTEAGCIDVTYRNDGEIAHTLLIRDVDGFKLSVGDTDEGTVQLEPGTYELFCDIPGHDSAGMVAELTVS